MGRIIKGALLGATFVLAVGVWPAQATVSSVSITKPTSSQVLAGSYGSDGSPSGFVVALQGKATTNCTNGFKSVSFRVSGVSVSYSKTVAVSPPQSDGTFTFNASWDTSDLKNGTYDVRIDVVEADDGLFTSCGQSGSAHTSSPAKLANPAAPPAWESAPSSSGGSPGVSFSWKKNGEPDIVEYHVKRSGPDGEKIFLIGASNPGSGCSLSGTTYSCTDPASNFPNPYGGTYTYSITAMRSRPDYNIAESPKTMCATSNPCVESASSDAKQVTLVDPTPTPTPTPTDTPNPGGTPTPGGKPTVGIGTPGGGGFGSGGSGSRGGTSVLGGGFGSGLGGGNPFYSGTYDERLPYTPKSLIIGNGQSTPNGENVQAGSVTAEAPNYRTIMLPVAGGLLAFLSAAHVRRLLLHF